MRTAKQPPPASPFNEHFDEYTNKLLKDFYVPGISVAVIDGDEVFSKVTEQTGQEQ